MRYIYHAVPNYPGIKKARPFKAFYTDSENHVQVIVQDDNKIRYGISGEWLSNDTPQYFDGESRIHIYSNRDHILIHDSKFL